MSYAQADMTNNRAEYLGAIAGLKESRERGWKVQVVGDSSLIRRQLREFQPPRHRLLRPLYAEARRLADQVQVDVGQLHVRAYNKMANQAANIAMDQQASLQASHSSSRPHVAAIESLMASDFREWHTRHLQRCGRD
jgi:ribonuclease HI